MKMMSYVTNARIFFSDGWTWDTVEDISNMIKNTDEWDDYIVYMCDPCFKEKYGHPGYYLENYGVDRMNDEE